MIVEFATCVVPTAIRYIAEIQAAVDQLMTALGRGDAL